MNNIHKSSRSGTRYLETARKLTRIGGPFDVLFILLSRSVSTGNSSQAPTFSNPNIPLSKSVDPGPEDGYTDQWTERAGAYWSFRPDTGTNGSFIFPSWKPTHPASSPRKEPPSAIQYAEDANVILEMGVLASGNATQGDDANDKALRLTGDDKSCVTIGNLSAEDTCLFDPSQCHLVAGGVRGLSMSVWLNLPNTFDTRTRYIFDTGGNENGNPGIAISYQSSQTGTDFNLALQVVVSTGSDYWKVALDGFLSPYQWSNLGVRWSPDVESSSGKVHGLQVFVNKVSVSWQRLPSPSIARGTNDTSSTPLPAPSRWTLGCRLDGTAAMIGRVDELGVWYWRVRDAAVEPGEPSGPKEYGELELFDGDLEFSKIDTPCANVSCLPGEPANAPTAYLMKPPPTDPASAITDGDYDASPAVEGDCLAVNPTTWKGDNMMHCVDTVNELREAIKSSPNFKALELVQAIVRIVNKAPSVLKQEDINYLYATLESAGLSRLNGEVPENKMNGTNGYSYMNIVYIISKLSEFDKYGELWHTEEVTQSRAGITDWNRICDDWLSVIGVGLMPAKDGPVRLYRSANHTAAGIIKLQPQLITGNVIFPNYDGDGEIILDEQFWKHRNATWGSIADTVTVPMARVLAFAKYTTLTLAMKIHNIFDLSVPAFLDWRINGLGEATFFVNSRVISLSANGTVADPSKVDANPISFTVQHRVPQDDRPFMKGAILCARWKYNENVTGSVGAWDTDGCALVKTDDGRSTCECAGEGDYAILMEKYSPQDAISATSYDVPLILYLVSIICLLIFMGTITASRRLHYEMHFVHSNLAFSIMMALIFYCVTAKANKEQAACVSVSVFLQYSYMSACAWFVLAAHYIWRAVVTGRLGRVLLWYTMIGWGFPAVVSTICVCTKVQLFGYGSRCFGSQMENFLKFYIGAFLVLCGFVFILIALAACNLRGKTWAKKNPQDWSDAKWALLGIALLWLWFTGVWVWAVFIYLVPQPYQVYDFLFELFNSIQGVAVLLFLGIMIPSFRAGLCCRPIERKVPLLTEENPPHHYVGLDPYNQVKEM